MFEKNLYAILICVNIAFAATVTVLLVYIVFQKRRNIKLDDMRAAFLRRAEDAFVKFTVEDDRSELMAITESLREHEFEPFIEYFSIYAGNVKGDELKKLTGVIGDSGLYKKLCESTRSSDTGIRLYSIYSLGLLGISDSAAHLRAALDDENLLINIVTISSLARIGDHSVIERVLDFLGRQRILSFERIAEIIWEYGDGACPKLYSILVTIITRREWNEKPVVTAAVIELLGRWKYMAAGPLLHQFICPAVGRCASGEDAPECPVLSPDATVTEEHVVCATINAFGMMLYSDAGKCILNFSRSHSSAVKVSCVSAFLELRDEVFFPRLAELLGDEDWNVRYAAAGALFSMGYDLQGYMFSADRQDAAFTRSCRTIVHVLTEKGAG